MKNKTISPYLFLMRNEGALVFKDLRVKIHTDKTEYDSFYNDLSDFFVSQLSQILKKNLLASFQSVKIDIHDLYSLEKRKKKLLRSRQAIVLDSYSQLTNEVRLGLSRIFAPGGEQQLAIGSRPGYPSIEKQISNLQKGKYCIIEDDVFTGKTLDYLQDILYDARIDIEEVIVGLSAVSLKKFPIPVSAVYAVDAREVIDMSDPRDFLMGSYEGGLVIRLGNSHVRLPYFLPFVNPTARLIISKYRARIFSAQILDLNRIIFQKINDELDIGIKLSDLSLSFSKAMIRLYNVNPEIRISDLIQIISKDISKEL